MSTLHRLGASAATAGLALGLTLASGTAATARVPDHDRGLASMSSPYVPGVWHVPSDVLLMLGPDGPVFAGPRGSLFNGPADRVGERVDAWWERQLAAGLTPEQADRKLARLNR